MDGAGDDRCEGAFSSTKDGVSGGESRRFLSRSFGSFVNAKTFCVRVVASFEISLSVVLMSRTYQNTTVATIIIT